MELPLVSVQDEAREQQSSGNFNAIQCFTSPTKWEGESFAPKP